MKTFNPQALKILMAGKKSSWLAREMRKRTGSATSTSQIDGWANGRIMPSTPNLMSLADVFGVPMEHFIMEDI
jgi:transcriptional regulator with XRE-family HTH domain